MNFAIPVAQLDWIPPQRARQLERFGLQTVEDLLTHFPRRYEDRTRFDRFPQDEMERPVCICGVVAKTNLRRIRGRQKMFDVILEENENHALSQPLVCRWFNAHWVEKMIVHGQRLIVFGKPKRSGSQISIVHPEFEIVEDETEVTVHMNRLAPIHRATEGISTRVMRQLIWDLLERTDLDSIVNHIPPTLDSTTRCEALRQIHFPDSPECLEAARRHLVLSEFFAMQLCVAAKRNEQGAQPGEKHFRSDDWMRRLHATLPFELTGAQQRAIAEIQSDLASSRPMNRLLHGDVGSGKTVVALSSMLLAAEAGYQAALMAPTQTLAEQHYLQFKRWLEPLGISVALRTGARREETAPLPLFEHASRNAAQPTPGTTRVSRVGDGVPPSQTLDSVNYLENSTYSKRVLPHFEKPWAIYAVTISTHQREILSAKARSIVLDAFKHFHRERYELFAACVMPDHVHGLLQPWVKEADANNASVFWSLPELLHSIKSYSAHAINRAERKTGVIWERESFDRYVRSDRDLAEKFQYIVRNPWESGVIQGDEDYPWIWTQADEREPVKGKDRQSPSRRDTGTNTRDACAPRSGNSASLGNGPQIVVGTHALLYEGAGLHNLGLAVIDEQHKFGVMQRARLRECGVAPDVLVMTATPIPRTLTMTLYGDLDVSTLNEAPKNRGKIVTGVRSPSKLPDAAQFIREHLAAGRQAYVVYPLIDESEKVEAKAAASEYKKWEKLMEPYECGLLHGRLSPDAKEAVMSRFRSGETKVLISTTVVEVGIDVPNATIMLIENAERFGLAQLHQLRGRIGRGEHKSYCILLSSAEDEESLDRLRILEKTSNGFEIAEADLQLRGPGDILGTAQSGLPPLKLGNLLADAELMKIARNHAFLLFEKDPNLEQPENAPYRRVLFETRKMLLSQVS